MNSDCIALDWDTIIQYPDAFDPFPDGKSAGQDTSVTVIQPTLQMPTPPETSTDYSRASTPDADIMIALSTTFHSSLFHQSRLPDIIIVSCDGVQFYVHVQTMMEASDNRFLSLFSVVENNQPGVGLPLIYTNDSSEVVNVVLHAIYNMSCMHFTPSFQTICAAVGRLTAYGVIPKTIITSPGRLYEHLLGYAPCNPLVLYALAGFWDLRELAVAASSHLLTCNLARISLAHTKTMGPLYLRRLHFLHLGRVDALKRILGQPLSVHIPTKNCSFVDQKPLITAYRLASSYLVWESRPGIQASELRKTLNELANHVVCSACVEGLFERTQHVVDEWLMVKCTI